MLPLSKRSSLQRLIDWYDRRAMRYPAALWTPGPVNKVNGGVNTVKGVVLHSMVGSWSAAYAELIKPTRRASWHFSVLMDGTVHQHYDTTAQTWHAGSAYNNSLVGIEHEGGLSPYNEPLTPAQLAASVALVRWLSQAHKFPMVRKVGLWEHNEVSGEPTACPSNRIPWQFYTEEDEMPIAELMWCTDEAKVYLVGPQGARWLPNAAPGKPVFDELAKLYGPMTKTTTRAALNAIGVVQ